MIKFLIIFLIIIPLKSFFAQSPGKDQLDSLFNSFVNFKSGQRLTIHDSPAAFTYEKCGLNIHNTVRENFENFSTEQQAILKTLLQRPVRDTSIITPGGFFRIHYNITGPEAPLYDLNELAAALDSTFNFEVVYLGYPQPPLDTIGGVDQYYNVYIEDLDGQRIYGYTDPDVSLGNGKYASYMGIDNDYNDFPTKGIDGARVTVAHEFHHAIQIGNYINRYSTDGFFYEITSTAMEDFVFDTINDYYFYIPSYFNNPQRAFAEYDGYETSIWNIFIRDKFGYDILKRQWELLPQRRALEAISQSLLEYGSAFGHELNAFGIWTYFTNYRTFPGFYFEEAAFYPKLEINSNIEFNSSMKTVQMSSKASSNYFLRFVKPDAAAPDTFIVIATNSDVNSGINNLNRFFTAEYTLSNFASEGSIRLNDDYYAKLSPDNPNFWQSTEILNNIILREGETSGDPPQYVFPSPFIYEKNTFVYIPVTQNTTSKVDFNVYTTGMELVYASSEDIINHPIGRKVLRWNPVIPNSGKLASGVYIYVIQSGDENQTGKLVIFNE
jgi:hypothetical protein